MMPAILPEFADYPQLLPALLAVPPQGMDILQEVIELGLRNLLWREGRHGAEAVADLKVLQEFREWLIVQCRS
jgi:hypothetical protein